MKKIQKKYKKILENISNLELISFIRTKVVVFGIIAIPITSMGAGMTIYIDNMSNIAQNPVFLQESVINLDENINVQFATPIRDTEKYEKTITIYPETDLLFEWNNKHTEVNIIPKTIWQPNTQYSLAFPHDAKKASTDLSTIFSFETITYPEVITTNIPQKENQYVSQGEEILITFDRDVDDFDVQAVVRPNLQTEQVYDTQNKTLHVKILEQAQNYKGYHALTLFAKHKKQDDVNFYPIDSLTFNTLLPRPDTYPKPFEERLRVAAASTPPKIKSGKYIDVNLEAQITTLFEDGKFVANFVDSTGADETPTPPGEYQIYNKHPYALSNMFQVYLPYWMAFTPDGLYGFHGLIVWPKGHEEMPQGGKESEKNIGNAVSAGCVRHDAQNSKFIYEWADIGTKVVIY